MKKLFLAMICVSLFVATGCSPESFVDGQNTGTDGKSTVITFSASMPDEGAQTRISLEREDLDIKLKWEEGDALELCLVYDGGVERQEVTVTRISEDGKAANFSVEVPEGVETFDLYGVYGGGGLDENDPTKALLPTAISSSTSGSLDELKENKAVMLTFAKAGIETAAPDLLVDFEHAGSLFCIQLRNESGSPWNNITTAQLSAGTPIGAYANTAVLDLATGAFSGTAIGNELTFELPSPINLASGELQEFWGWFVPVPDQNWPEISLKVIDGSDVELASSVNSKPARTAATPAGRAFYFPATYDGTGLRFDAPLVDIDGNIYATVVIGDLEWMAENLRVTHYRNGDPITTGLSDTEWANTFNDGRVGAYAVYPYTQTGGAIESEEEMIAQYGLLYNGYVIKDSRGLAPEGWRVATDEDYQALERIAGLTEEQVNNTGWRGSHGLKLRSSTGWPVNNGTDDFGFKALPAGTRESNGTFRYFNVRANFWTETYQDGSTTILIRRILEDSRPLNINRSGLAMREGLSIRCVRDR